MRHAAGEDRQSARIGRRAACGIATACAPGDRRSAAPPRDRARRERRTGSSRAGTPRRRRRAIWPCCARARSWAASAALLAERATSSEPARASWRRRACRPAVPRGRVAVSAASRCSSSRSKRRGSAPLTRPRAARGPARGAGPPATRSSRVLAISVACATPR